MKHSIRLKMTIILSLLFALMILLCWLINDLFIEDYYLNKKISSLSQSYYSLNTSLGTSKDIDSDSISDIERIEAHGNVSIYIIAASDENRNSLSFIYPISLDMNQSENNNSTSIFRFDKYKRIIEALQVYLIGYTGNRPVNPELLKIEDGGLFGIYKFPDINVDTYFIDLLGYLNNDSLVLIRTSYENISEGASIAGQFLAICAAIIIILGSVFVFIYSRKFTQPILTLARISDQMAGLDFSQKYKGKYDDEIGTLGNSINTLSDRLENTITDLKHANIELQKDIQNKEQIEEMRKEFLSNVSHELKTPIALIQGYAEGLSDNINESPEDRAFYCDVIIDEARKMNSIVKKLLSLNEIESGRDKISIEQFDLTELVSSIAQSMNILAQQKNVTIIHCFDRPLVVWADPGLIEEVVTNYMSNALNHVCNENIINISYIQHENKIRCSVFNTGKPIPENDISNVWEKFYKVDKARTREYGGSGIGLSIVKAIMEQHNEKYGLINHSNGVEFWFELDMNTDTSIEKDKS